MAEKTDAVTKKKIVVKRVPLVISKDKLAFINGENSKNGDILFKTVRYPNTIQHIKEDLIYESCEGDFLKGDPHKVVLLNRLNVSNNCSRTVAKCTSATKTVIEKTSDNVTKLIGQKNYDTVFSALCSVINQELKIRGMLALLTPQKKCNVTTQCQTELTGDDYKLDSKPKTLYVESSSQTDESCMEILHKYKQQRKRIKRQHLQPYVVKDDKLGESLKKVIINPKQLSKDKVNNVNLNETESVKSTNDNTDSRSIGSTEIVKPLPDLKAILDEDSNISNTSYGNLSLSNISIPEMLENPKYILKQIDNCTERPRPSYKECNPTIITLFDGSQISVPVKPEDQFHIAIPDILNRLTREERTKILWHQAYIDWKYCLERNEDENMLIHLAALNNDVDLLRRQCLVLKTRQTSVDITARGSTPLQISIQQDTSPHCTMLLLQHGADPLHTDEEQRTTLHLAAEGSTLHLKVILNHCQSKARQILYENEELWKKEYEYAKNEELARVLLTSMCNMCDNQGYTPLMLASKLGNAGNVKLLLEAAPATVNRQMPTCGDTALYLAVGGACLDAVDRGNRSKVAEHYVKTIEVLLESGADPSIDNHSGANVNVLLTEFNITELSILVAKKLTSIKYFQGNMSGDKNNLECFMLIKDQDGNVNIKEYDKSMKTIKIENTFSLNDKDIKPVILENIPVKVPTLRPTRKSNTSPQRVLPDKFLIMGTNSKLTKNKKSQGNVTNVASVLNANKIVDKASNIIIEKDNVVSKMSNPNNEKGVSHSVINILAQTNTPAPTPSAGVAKIKTENPEIETVATYTHKRKPSDPLDLTLSPTTNKKSKVK